MSICFFCKNSGETEKTYTSHTKHTCQKLANIECLKCGAKGHTERYCDNSGQKYTTHAKKPAAPADDWQEPKKKTPLVFHVGVAAPERPVTPPPPPKNDEMTFPTLVEPVKPAAAKTLNFAALKFEQQQQPTVVKSAPETVVKSAPETVVKSAPETVITSTVVDTDFPVLPRRTPPARSPPPLPTIHEADVANMTSDEVVDTINSNIKATEMAEKTAQQLTGVIASLSTTLHHLTNRYDAKCQEFDALLKAYNDLVCQQQQQDRWGKPGSDWADS